MNRSGAAAQLLRIGRAAGPRAEAGGIRFTALLLAAFLLPLGLAAPVIAGASVEGRHERAMRFSVTTARPDTPDEEILLFLGGIDKLANSRQYEVHYLTPLGPDAPLPPGIDSWPEPGQVYLSPHLAEIGAAKGIDDRYGEVVGTIDAHALIDPNHLLAYVFPAEPLTRAQNEDFHLTEITAFGAGDAGYNVVWLLPSDDFSPMLGFYLFIVFLLTIPACLLAYAASRVAAHARDRREALIRVLGGRPRHTLLVSFGETWRPVAAGSALAAAALGILLAADVPLPHVAFVLSAADARAVWPVLAACLLVSAAALFSMSLLVPTARLQGREPTRQPRGARLLAILALLFPVFTVVAVWGPRLFPKTSIAFYLTNYVGQVGIIVTVTPAVALGCAALARAAKRLRWTRTHPSALTATARIAAHPRATARQLAAVIAAFFVMFFAFAYHSSFTAWLDEDRASTAVIGGSVADASPKGSYDRADIDAFLTGLPDNLLVFAWATEYEVGDGTTTISGSCATFTAVDLACPDGGPEPLAGEVADARLARMLQRGGGAEVLVADTPVAEFLADRQHEEEGGGFLLVTPDGVRVPEAAIMAAGRTFQLGLDLSIPGGDEPDANPYSEHGRWISGFGTVALAILALASVLSASGEFLRHGRALAPIGVLTGGLRTFRATSAITVFLPLLIGTAVGVVVGVSASSNLMKPGETLVRPGYLLPTTLSLLVVSALMWFWASTVAIREAAKWTPGRGD